MVEGYLYNSKTDVVYCKLYQEREHSFYKCEACLSNMHRVGGFWGKTDLSVEFEKEKTNRQNYICFCRNVSTETLIFKNWLVQSFFLLH